MLSVVVLSIGSLFPVVRGVVRGWGFVSCSIAIYKKWGGSQVFYDIFRKKRIVLSADGASKGQEAVYWVLDSGFWILGTWLWILGAGFLLPDTGTWNPHTVFNAMII